MPVPDVFKNLALDAWYKGLVYIGGLALVVSLFVEVKGVTNGQAELFALGVFLFGLGEWKNQKTAVWMKPPNAYTGPAGLMSTKVRKPDAFGLTCDVLGLLLILAGAMSIVVKLFRG